jgi:hypothetical protein
MVAVSQPNIFHCVQIIINSDANKLVGAPLPLSCSVTSAALITVIAPQPLNFASERAPRS